MDIGVYFYLFCSKLCFFFKRFGGFLQPATLYLEVLLGACVVGVGSIIFSVVCLIALGALIGLVRDFGMAGFHMRDCSCNVLLNRFYV